MDVLIDNKPSIGITIYQVDGDELLIAESTPGNPRPTSFTAPGPGQVVFRYRRENASEQWTQLFNGKDLTGWNAKANWKVETGILTSVVPGKSDQELYTIRDDFADFHLRAEVKINDGGNSGIWFRVPSGGWQQDSYEAQINSTDADPIKTGSLWQLGAAYAVVKSPIPPDTWFTYEIIAVRDHITLKVNGVTTTDWTDPKWRHKRGYIALQQFTPNTLVQFRKIEIKELPPNVTSPPRLPDTAEQVLPALAGNWKGEFTQRIYAGKPAEKKFTAISVNDWIVGNTWLRQRVHMENGGYLSLTSFDANSQSFRDWFFHASGLIFGPSAGRWDPATRSITWTSLPQNGILMLNTWRFVDADTVSWEAMIRDKEGQTIFQMDARLQRSAETPTIDETTTAGPLPPEMAVLERLVGEWETSGIVKNAKNPDGRKADWRSSVRSILGGRVIATHRTGSTSDDDDESISLATFDTFSKAYGRWSFRPNGNVLEYGGLWDEANQMLKWHWAGKDGSQTSNTWNLRDPNRYDWQVLTKDALGKTTFEVQATSVRQSEPGWAQLFNGKDVSGWRVVGGKPGAWKVENGVLWAVGDAGYLVSDKSYADFHLKAEVRVSPRHEWGMGFRTDRSGYGCAADFIYKGSVGDKAGQIHMDLEFSKDGKPVATSGGAYKPNDWHPLEVIAQGNRVTIKLAGRELGGTELTLPAGPIVLQLGKQAGSLLEFRKIEIKELPAESKAGPVKLRSFTPGKDKLPIALRPASGSVSVDGDAWRIENKDDKGNFNIMIAQVLDGVPKDGLLIFRAKVKVDAKDKLAWGNLGFGGPNHLFFDWKGWPEAMARYDGSNTEWIEKEMRHPAAECWKTDPPAIYLYAGLHAKGVLWLKDAELLHLPLPVTSQGRSDETVIHRYTRSDKPITAEYVDEGKEGWRFTTHDAKKFRLFELTKPEADNCRLIFRAQLKSTEAREAYLRMIARFPGEEGALDTIGKRVTAAEGDTNWTTYEVTLDLKPGQRPEMIELNLQMEGRKRDEPGLKAKNQVWIKDIELLKAPPP
jgi:hypothetical protein